MKSNMNKALFDKGAEGRVILARQGILKSNDVNGSMASL